MASERFHTGGVRVRTQEPWSPGGVVEEADHEGQWKLRAAAEVFFVHLLAFSSLAFSFVFFLLLDRLHARLLHLAICFTSGECNPISRGCFCMFALRIDSKAGGIRRRPGHRRAQAGRWSSPVNTPQIQRICFVASFISLFILVGLGSQLLGG